MVHHLRLFHSPRLLLIAVTLLPMMTNVSGCQTADTGVSTVTVMDFDYPECKPPMLIDLSGAGWDDTLGRSTIDRAKYVCYSRYAGCLSRLTRRTELAFRALCRRR